MILLERCKFCNHDTFSSLFNRRGKEFFLPFERIKLKRSNARCGGGVWIPEIRYWREVCLLTFLRFSFNAADSMGRINDSDFKGTFTTGVRKIGRVPVGAATSIVIVIVIAVVVVVDVVSRPDLALRAMQLRYANSLCYPAIIVKIIMQPVDSILSFICASR